MFELLKGIAVICQINFGSTFAPPSAIEVQNLQRKCVAEIYRCAAEPNAKISDCIQPKAKP